MAFVLVAFVLVCALVAVRVSCCRASCQAQQRHHEQYPHSAEQQPRVTASILMGCVQICLDLLTERKLRRPGSVPSIAPVIDKALAFRMHDCHVKAK